MNHTAQQKVVVNDIRRGLVYAHNRANANTAEVHQANATLHALVELLVDRGVLDAEAFEERREQASEQLRRRYLERGMAAAMQEFGVSKYEFESGAEIDCESRLHLCNASCCRLPFALSKQDVQEEIDCRKDKRICLDFENCVVNPRVNEPSWLAGPESQTSASEEA